MYVLVKLIGSLEEKRRKGEAQNRIKSFPGLQATICQYQNAATNPAKKFSNAIISGCMICLVGRGERGRNSS